MTAEYRADKPVVRVLYIDFCKGFCPEDFRFNTLLSRDYNLVTDC